MAKNHSFAIEFDRLMLELNMMLTNMHEYIVMNLICESIEQVEDSINDFEIVDRVN